MAAVKKIKKPATNKEIAGCERKWQLIISIHPNDTPQWLNRRHFAYIVPRVPLQIYSTR